MRGLSKRLRGKDFRAAVQAQGGTRALAGKWTRLPEAQWREQLVSEIGQSLALWAEEGTIELLLAALEDEPHVARRAVSVLKECLRAWTDRERKQTAKTQRGKAALEAIDRLRSWITPARRARIAAAVGSALARCANDPRELTWPDDYIQLLGLTATRRDARALALLDGLRPKSGQTRRTEVEKLDRDDLPWPTSALADGKGVPPGTPMMRVKSIATGLLDLENLEQAIAAINAREE